MSGPDLDRAAAAAVAAGDPEAFSGIVERWQGPLVNLAYRYCRDRSLAEDMAQEAFLKAYRGMATWRGEGVFSSWLFGVALNAYRSFLRRKRLPLVPLEAAGHVPDGAGELQEALERRDRRRAVRAAVGRLPAKYRDAVMLFYFFDMDVAAAAEILKVPTGTLKARLHRARGRLARDLGKRARRPTPERTDQWMSSTEYSSTKSG